MRLLSIGVRVETKETNLGDKIAEPLANKIEEQIKKAIEQIVKDMSHASGHEMEVHFS